MNSLLKLGSTLTLSLLLTACFAMDLKQSFRPDGTIHMDMTVDFSEFQNNIDALATLAEMSGEEVGDEAAIGWDDMQQFCDDIVSQSEADGLDASCRVVSPTKAIASVDLEESAFEQGVFEVLSQADGSTVYRLKPYGSSRDYTKSSQSDMDTESLEALGGLFFDDWSYTVQLPGRITSADIGQITKSDTVTMNFMTIMSNPEAIIESTVQPTSRPVYTSQRNRSVRARPSKQDRICARVDRYRNHGSVYSRVNDRIERRFGFRCDR